MNPNYRLHCNKLFERANEGSLLPKHVVFLSVEGTKTEVQYFDLIQKHRAEMKIDAIVQVEVLRRTDTKSDPESVLELLDEYMAIREDGGLEKVLARLELRSFDRAFIEAYRNDKKSVPPAARKKFESVLNGESVDLQYLHFLNRYKGENDVFGIVIDRDAKSHTAAQMRRVQSSCREKGYHCFITNPCFEFWLLLHVSDVSTEYADHLEEIKENRIGAGKRPYVAELLHNKTGQKKNIKVKTFTEHYLPNVDLAIERAESFAKEENLIDEIGSNLGELFGLLRKPRLARDELAQPE